MNAEFGIVSLTKKGGGNIALRSLWSLLNTTDEKNLIRCELIEPKILSCNSNYKFIKYFLLGFGLVECFVRCSWFFRKKNSCLIFSDPLFGFLCYPFPKNKLVRWVQSIDEDLHTERFFYPFRWLYVLGVRKSLSWDYRSVFANSANVARWAKLYTSRGDVQVFMPPINVPDRLYSKYGTSSLIRANERFQVFGVFSSLRFKNFFDFENIARSVIVNHSTNIDFVAISYEPVSSRYVRWEQFQSRIEMFEALRFANVLLSTSRIDSLGLPLIEAMILGIPVISFPSDGAKEIWEEGLFTLTPDSDQAVIDLLEFYENRGSYLSSQANVLEWVEAYKKKNNKNRLLMILRGNSN